MTGATHQPTGGSLEKTLAIIKPDAVRSGKADEIVQLAELAGFKVLKRRKFLLTKQRAEEFYGEHQGKPFFPALIGFMTSGPIYALIFGRDSAVKQWREFMGPTNSLKAREEAPKSLRALYGTDGTMNATHGSDSQHSARREIKFFFPEFKSLPITDPAGCKKYIADNLQPTLMRGLTVLAKEKPSASKYEALTFLATWLLENNPNKPLVVGEMDLNIGEDEDDEAEFEGFEEELDLEDPELNVAATKIQASFRGSQTRKDMVSKKLPAGRKQPATVPEDDTESEHQHAAADEAVASDASAAAGATIFKAPNADGLVSARDPAVDAEVAEMNLQDPELSVAATKIQAGFRGHQARAEVAAMKPTEANPAGKDEIGDPVNLHKELPLDDPELGAAATKIQAGFRGHQARAELAAKKTEQATANTDDLYLHQELPLDDPELGAAATKIQASFRGHQTRKEMTAAAAPQLSSQ